MIKRDLLQKLSLAKQLQKSNLKKALLLAKGPPSGDDPVAVDYKECAFEKLLHENETELMQIVGPSFFSEIEGLHKQWHQDYNRIYDLYYHHEKGFVSKWSGEQHKLSERELVHAGAYISHLKEATCRIVHLLEMVESRIKTMKDDAL